MDALTRTVKEEGPAALYRGLAPNVLRGMANNVGQLACYDQAKEVFSKLLNDPMTNGPAPLTVFGASLVAVSATCRFVVWIGVRACVSKRSLSVCSFSSSLFLP
jgi:hypothetical protein